MTDTADPKSGHATPQSGTRANNEMESARCKHARNRLIAKDEDGEYWECLDCGEIYEPGENGGIVNLDGSLSDA